ncbi:MAG: TIGR04283 family arsenosugar biosynthesis glycosyltransferase [Candidatus Binatia bacterium]
MTVVIPVLDEARNVEAAIASAKEAEEVVVVDGGSVDDTRTRSRASGAVVVAAGRGRGRQMNVGAAAATGDVLVFLHADTVLPSGFSWRLARLTREFGAGWGRFDIRFDSGGPLLRLIARLICWRSRLSRLATGDQAIFVRRDLFFQVGGFREQLLFEDLGLCRRLRRVAAMAVPVGFAVTSSRRWREDGTLRVTLLMWGLRLLNYFGVSGDRLAPLYYRGVDGE